MSADTEAIKRAIYLLQTVAAFMEKNWQAAECTIRYDEAVCDGLCLGDDCRAAAEELDILTAREKGVA